MAFCSRLTVSNRNCRSKDEALIAPGTTLFFHDYRRGQWLLPLSIGDSSCEDHFNVFLSLWIRSMATGEQRRWKLAPLIKIRLSVERR